MLSNKVLMRASRKKEKPMMRMASLRKVLKQYLGQEKKREKLSKRLQNKKD